MKKNNVKHHLLIEINTKVRDKFKSYCKGQGVSMKLGLNVLMESAVRRNVEIKHRAAI